MPGLHLLSHARHGVRVPRPAGPRWESLLWFGTGRRAELTALGDLQARAKPVEATWAKLALEGRGGGAPSRLTAFVRGAPATLAARRLLRSERVEVVLGLGGLVQLPVVLAARSLGLPVALLEVNAVMGTTTRRLAPLAARVLHAWRASLPASPSPRRVFADRRWRARSPSRATTRSGGARTPEAAAGPAADLVLGGSQGAAGLNRFVAAEVESLTARGAFVLHQVGPGRMNEGAASGSVSESAYRAAEFLDDVHALLAAATLVLCRGGASTLAEVAAARVPAWVVPYPHHADHQQERNARELGAGVRIVHESDLDASVAHDLARLAAASGAALSSRGGSGGTDAAEGVPQDTDAAELSAMAAELAQRVPRDAALGVLDQLEALVRA